MKFNFLHFWSYLKQYSRMPNSCCFVNSTVSFCKKDNPYGRECNNVAIYHGVTAAQNSAAQKISRDANFIYYLWSISAREESPVCLATLFSLSPSFFLLRAHRHHRAQRSSFFHSGVSYLIINWVQHRAQQKQYSGSERTDWSGACV